VLTRPGEYEVKGVFVTGIQTWRGAGVKEEAKEENTVFVFEFGELTVCHLGDLSRVLTQAQVESMPDIDILLVPVGGGGALDADKAAEVISQLEPRVVIPMHYRTPDVDLKLDPLSKFLKEMGVAEQAPQEALKLTRSTLPDETLVVILECKQG
jgi:L-ascorbate metabolism protein UlaG (beta-lactamase superfamily)